MNKNYCTCGEKTFDKTPCNFSTSVVCVFDVCGIVSEFIRWIPPGRVP